MLCFPHLTHSTSVRSHASLLVCAVGHFKDEGRALFRSTWSPLSAFAHPRNPRKGLTVPQELKLNGVTEREKRFEAKADNLLHMLDRVHLHLAAVEKTETATDEDDSSDDDR